MRYKHETPENATYLLAHLRYNPLTGIVSREIKGQWVQAGTKESHGGRHVRKGTTSFCDQRLAFLFMLGRWPTSKVVHLNRIRDDNRWDNLAESHTLHAKLNLVAAPASLTGLRGITKVSNGKYRVTILVRRKKVHIGTYPTTEQARAAFVAHMTNLVRKDEHIYPFDSNKRLPEEKVRSTI